MPGVVLTDMLLRILNTWAILIGMLLPGVVSTGKLLRRLKRMGCFNRHA